jgi:hypothetical protein
MTPFINLKTLVKQHLNNMHTCTHLNFEVSYAMNFHIILFLVWQYRFWGFVCDVDCSLMCWLHKLWSFLYEDISACSLLVCDSISIKAFTAVFVQIVLFWGLILYVVRITLRWYFFWIVALQVLRFSLQWLFGLWYSDLWICSFKSSLRLLSMLWPSVLCHHVVLLSPLSGWKRKAVYFVISSCDTFLSCRWTPTFRRNMLLSTSGLKVILNIQFPFNILHDVATQRNLNLRNIFYTMKELSFNSVVQ